MASLTPSPKMQFFDANGNPLSGGKLYTYAAGTTTPQATYTDSTGGTPNANPVVMNSRGEASVWLGSSLYYMELKDSTDSLIWTSDNIGGFATTAELSAFETALAATSGSSLVGFIQLGSGASIRTAQSKMRDFVSVKDFGAIGDGTTDDTVSIQAAVTAAINGEVYFPPGIYKLTNRIVISDSVKIRGGGTLTRGDITASLIDGSYPQFPSGVIFLVTFQQATATEVFYVNSSTNEQMTAEFDSVEFFCSYQPTIGVGWAPTDTPWAIRTYTPSFQQGAQHVEVKNCIIRNFTHGIKAQTSIAISNLYSQCFKNDIVIENAYDVCNLSDIYCEGVWSTDSNVLDYMLSNAVALTLGRVDNPFINNFFSIYHLVGIEIRESDGTVTPSGSLSLGNFSNLGFDFNTIGIRVNTSTSGVTANINNSYIFNSTASGSEAVQILGTAASAYFQLSNLDINAPQWAAIDVLNTTSTVSLSNVRIRSYNQENVGKTAINAAAGSKIILENVNVDTTQGNGTAALSTTGTFYGDIVGGTAWTAYTPTVTSETGTLTTVSATGLFKVIGKTIHFQAVATITDNGTGATSLRMTLPVTSGGYFIVVGRDEGSTGKELQGRVGPGGSLVRIVNYDGTYPAVSGSLIIVSGTYQST